MKTKELILYKKHKTTDGYVYESFDLQKIIKTVKKNSRKKKNLTKNILNSKLSTLIDWSYKQPFPIVYSYSDSITILSKISQEKIDDILKLHDMTEENINEIIKYILRKK